ncbi:DNA-directed RNA polymerase i subunit rpa49 [Phtheirospermum japonicum]|uniref:DNA-directed RNA polymerase i subunit rpa49 n=1 Tax=Phtheirospermum japonicum TaxID=374723 RepID=A0A830BHR3_9LAMI|nr:DNA-directed RNA polymerase i subunit rpa49 [Phtheirospermum japonicum]
MAKLKEKKRKLGEQGTENVEKVEKLETLDVIIKEIGDHPDTKTSPVIGYFPSGYDPLKNSNDPESESEPESNVKIYRSINSRNPRNPRMQVVVGASGSLVNFVGTNYSGEATAPQLCNYALGVLDKETGVLKMVPIAANRIFRLDPKVGGMEQPENEPVDGDKEEITKEEKDDKFKNLTALYSTKQNVRRDVTREKLRQTEEPGMEGNMEQKLKGIKINPEAIEAIPSTANERNIPPYDVEATSPDMAYPLDQIILKGDWKFLEDIFELVEAGSDVSYDVYPSFVCNRVHKIGNIKDELKRKRMAGILSYMTHLIKYKDRHSMDGVSSSRRHKLPSILAQKFSSMFSITKENRIPDEKQKLLISYVLVLSLFADDFRSDPSDIAKDLRINFVTLRPFYKFLGCKFVTEKKVVLATLPVPLQFETIKRKRRK